jgi:hypothetical protein
MSVRGNTPDPDEWILVSVQNHHTHYQTEGHYRPLDAWTAAEEDERNDLRVFVNTGTGSWGWILNLGPWLQFAQRFPTSQDAQEALDAQSPAIHTRHGPMGEPVRVDDPRLVPFRQQHAQLTEERRMADNRARSKARAREIGRGK